MSIRKKQHFWLSGTLRRFAQRQITYDLYEENEACDKPFVFSFAGKTFKEEKSGRIFEKLDDAVAFMREVRPPAVWVEDAGGQLAEDLLLRHYQDDSVVVLDLSAKNRDGLRLMRRGGKPVSFELPARGVFVNQAATSPRDVRGRFGEASLPLDAAANSPSVKQVPCTNFSLALSKANTFRLAFGTNKTARLKVENTVEAARIAIRNTPASYTVTLDGKPVRADQPCDTLQQGLNELYRQTAPFRLEPGEHTFAITDGGGDTIYYLPVAWLTGDFAVEQRAVRSLPKSVGVGALWKQGLADFAGSVTYTAQVEVPRHAGELRLRLNTGGLYAAVSLAGQPLGERAWAPFEWTVPDGVKGKSAELKMTVWTSVAPLFGDWKNPEAGWNKKFWVPPPSAHREVGLIAAPEWVFE